MGPPELNEDLHARILEYATEPKACVSCKPWKHFLYDSLKLDTYIRFHQRLKDQDELTYCYNVVRPLGEDFEESVGFNFQFFRDGTYRLAWTRTFDAWSSQGEQHYGTWKLKNEHVCCETHEPQEEAGETEMRYAPAGYKFSVPVDDILNAQGGYFQAEDGAKEADWELPARTGKASDGQNTVIQGNWEPVPAVQQEAVQRPVRPDSRYVEIDGVIHGVSGDIVANWPEDDWPRLMRCRLLFGIRG